MDKSKGKAKETAAPKATPAAPKKEAQPAAVAAPAATTSAKKEPAGKKEASPAPVAAKGKGKEETKAAPAKEGKKSKEVKEQTPEPRPEEKHENAYIEVLSHRQRGLRKRLTKIERNEELKAQGAALNEDQLHSITQKQEVEDLIRELDELIKHLVQVASEQEKEAKQQAKLKKIEENKQQQLAKEQQQEEIKHILQFVYLLSVLGNEEIRNKFTSGEVDGFSLTQDQLNSLSNFNSHLFPVFNPALGLPKTVKSIHQNVSKLFAKSNDQAIPGLSYSATFNLLSSISSSAFFDLDVAAQLAAERAEREAAAIREAARLAAEAEAAAEAARREQEEMQNSYEIIDLKEIPASSPLSRDQINGAPAPTLAFMGESELLGGEPALATFDQSPSVIVPVPQALFEAHGTITNIPLGVVPLVQRPKNAWNIPVKTAPAAQQAPAASPAASSSSAAVAAPTSTESTQVQEQPSQQQEASSDASANQQVQQSDRQPQQPRRGGYQGRGRGGNYKPERGNNPERNHSGNQSNFHQKTNYQERNFSGGYQERRQGGGSSTGGRGGFRGQRGSSNPPPASQ